MQVKDFDPTDTARCSYCGIKEHIHLLNGVLDENGNDTGKLGCIVCYPTEGWCPTGGREHFVLSIAPNLKPFYDKMERMMAKKQSLIEQKLQEILDAEAKKHQTHVGFAIVCIYKDGKSVAKTATREGFAHKLESAVIECCDKLFLEHNSALSA